MLTVLRRGLFPCGTRGHRRAGCSPGRWPRELTVSTPQHPADAPCSPGLAGHLGGRCLTSFMRSCCFFNIIKKVIGILLKFDIPISFLDRKSLSAVT